MNILDEIMGPLEENIVIIFILWVCYHLVFFLYDCEYHVSYCFY